MINNRKPNWKYFLGKSFSVLVDQLVKNDLVPFPNYFLRGSHWVHDLKSFSQGRKFNTIFDAGANMGQTSLYVTRFFPNAVIHAFEPVDFAFQKLAANTAKYSNIQSHPIALGNFQGKTAIALGENIEVNSLLLEALPGRPQQEVWVETIGHFCSEHRISRIDLLKIDVEGFELPVLEGAGTLLQSGVAFVYAEFGYSPKDPAKTYLGDLDCFLVERGFRLCGLYESFRRGEHKQFLDYGNALYLNTALIQ